MPSEAVPTTEEYMRVRSSILAQQGNASSPPIPIGAAALGGISDGATADKSEKQQEDMDSCATTIHFLSPASQEDVAEEEKWDSNAMHAVEVGSAEISADGSPQEKCTVHAEDVLETPAKLRRLARSNASPDGIPENAYSQKDRASPLGQAAQEMRNRSRPRRTAQPCGFEPCGQAQPCDVEPWKKEAEADEEANISDAETLDMMSPSF